MPFDFKKEEKMFYLPKNVPEIVEVPRMNYIAVRGKGDPNEQDGMYQQAVGILYAISYTIKMSHKGSYKIQGFFEYVVPPLESFWWQDGIEGVDLSDKSRFCWICAIRLPDFVSLEDVQWAAAQAEKKKKIDGSAAEFLTMQEGLCVQMMHLGSYDTESESVARMDQYLLENGYQTDFPHERLHHEIYLSDPRKSAPEKWKTVIRHPIKQG